MTAYTIEVVSNGPFTDPSYAVKADGRTVRAFCSPAGAEAYIRLMTNQEVAR